MTTYEGKRAFCAAVLTEVTGKVQYSTRGYVHRMSWRSFSFESLNKEDALLSLCKEIARFLRLDVKFSPEKVMEIKGSDSVKTNFVKKEYTFDPKSHDQSNYVHFSFTDFMKSAEWDKK